MNIPHRTLVCRAAPRLPSEVTAISRAEPEPNEMSPPLGLFVVLIRSPAMDDDPIVEDLDLPRLEPKVEAVAGILEELVHEPHRRRPRRVEHPPGLLVTAEGVPGVEAGAEPAVPREHRPEVRDRRVGGLVFLMIAIERLVQAPEQPGSFAEEMIVCISSPAVVSAPRVSAVKACSLVADVVDDGALPLLGYRRLEEVAE